MDSAFIKFYARPPTAEERAPTAASYTNDTDSSLVVAPKLAFSPSAVIIPFYAPLLEPTSSPVLGPINLVTPSQGAGKVGATLFAHLPIIESDDDDDDDDDESDDGTGDETSEQGYDGSGGRAAIVPRQVVPVLGAKISEVGSKSLSLEERVRLCSIENRA